MLRRLAILIALALFASPANAQVFKRKSKKPAAAKAEKKATKKKPRTAPTNKSPAAKKKAAARPDDDESESASKRAYKDNVTIWDEEEIETAYQRNMQSHS